MSRSLLTQSGSKGHVLEHASRDAGGSRAALWSAIDNGAAPGSLADATEDYLAAWDGRSSDQPAVLVAAAYSLEAGGRRLVEAGRLEEAVRVLGVALQAAGKADHLVLATSLLGLREEVLVDLGRNSDPLQQHFARRLARSDGAGAGGSTGVQDRPGVGAQGRRRGMGAGEGRRPLLEQQQDLAGADSEMQRAIPVQMPAAPRPGVQQEAGASDRGQTVQIADLGDYLEVLRHRRWSVALTTVVVVAIGLGFSLTQTPIYESSARVFVEGESVSSVNQPPQQAAPADQQLETFSQLIESEAVAVPAAEKLQGEASPAELLEQVDARRIVETQLLEISATSPDRQRAVAIAQAFAEAFLDYRADQALDQVSRANEALRRREQGLRNRLDEIDEELDEVSADAQAELQAEQQRLKNELTGLAAQQASLSGSEALARGGGEVVRPAAVPREPISPRPVRTGIEALVLGLLLGAGLAFFRDFRDDRLRSERQAREATGASTVGHIPVWEAAERDRRRLVTLMEPASPAAEAYRTLRTNVRYLLAGRKIPSLVVSSSVPQEGKTTTAGNLAVTLADAGLRTLLVDADLRNPMVHEALGIDQSPGLMELIVGDVDIEEALVDVVVDGLRVLPAGTVPPNPAELLGSKRMTDLVAQLEEHADVVIYDSAPILAVADTLELGQLVGTTLMVIDVQSSRERAVQQAADRLRGVGSQLAGVVLNNLEARPGYYGDYYGEYSSKYYSGEED